MDLSSGSFRVTDHSRHNTTWFVEALVRGTGDDVYRVQLVNGSDVFDNITIYSKGSYDLSFVVFEITSNRREYLDYTCINRVARFCGG